MLDIKLIRKEPDVVRTALARRDPGLAAVIDEILDRDSEWRAATESAENMRAKQRADSENIAAGKRAGADVSEALARMKQLSADVKTLTEQARVAQEQLDAKLAPLPNLPDPAAAGGPEDELVRSVGEPPSFAFEPRDHLELAGGLIDMERAARLSGSRFAYLLGDLVLVELALVRWALDVLRTRGFEPVVPPVLVREQALYGTGFLPDTEQQIYALPADELYLAGTSEVALASLHAEEIIDAERLPLRYAGFSPCFRREAGAAGKDTRGIFRVHQFDKVEMFSFVAPEESPAEHERILAIEEHILSELGIPYRVMNIAVTDLGASAAIKYDCEAWLPGQGRYRELTSCSNTTDYQARRLNIRMRAGRGRDGGGREERGRDGRGDAERGRDGRGDAEHGREERGGAEPGREERGRAGGGREGHGGRGGLDTVHTLNGTAVAVGRTLVALLECGQREDGSVILPEVLIPYGAPSRLAQAGSIN